MVVMMMMKVVGLFSLLVVTATEAATKVAVLEFGKGGTVRRTDASSSTATVEGVISFWNALHRGRRLQHAGMSVVPDLFRKADVGLVLGISGSGVDLDHMPVISSLLESASDAVVGLMEVEGMQCGQLLSKVDNVETVAESSPPSAVKEACHKHASKGSGFSGVQTTIDASNVAEFDGEMSSLVQDLQNLAESSGKTIVLHLVVEEEGGASRRRLSSSSRRLEEEAEGENQQENADGQEGDKAYSGYYGYGYYNAYGEWVTPYKTMFQIQYFNVVLWTSVGLFFTLFFVIYLMLFMPLEPDTLLFGESAKMVGAE